MNIIAIDPHWAKPYAFCMWLQDTAVDWGMTVYDLLDGYLSDPMWDKVIIEEPYLGMNVNTLTKLCYSVGMVIGLCEQLELPWAFVKPMHWKKWWGLTKLKGGAYTTRKKIILPDKIPETDEGDAYLIGEYWLRKNKYKNEGV